MTAEHTDETAPAAPRCPSCAQPMRLVRRTRRFGGLPDLYLFECRSCGISHAEEGRPPKQGKFKSDIGSWYLDEFGNPTREIKNT